jgi:3-hydroxyisobutyrate dehydrogenase-like beta-hydroxyacid dehydrogenase
MARLGFVGLGVMGGPMAGHLRRSGAELVVWNRTPAKAEPLREAGAAVADNLAELAAQCEIVMLCVSRSEDVRDCLFAMAPSARPGTLFVDHSTISPSVAIGLHRWVAERGHRFVDAPITGGSMGAQKGQLTIFLGGPEGDVDAAKSAIRPYTKRAERVGGAGAGQMAKMANQIAVAGSLLGLCESLSFAAKAGLDLAQIRDLVGGGAGGSWAFENYGPKILAEDWSPGFSVANQRKDFGYVLESAAAMNAAVPGTALVDALLARLTEAGKGELATTALYEVLRDLGDEG